MVVPEESIGHVIGKCRENFNTIETTTGVSLKVRNNEFYIKAESEKTEKLAVRKIKELAVGIFGVKNSAKLRNSYENVRNDMGKLVRGLYYTRTVRINDSFFFRPGLHNSQLSQTVARIRQGFIVWEAKAYLVTRNS